MFYNRSVVHSSDGVENRYKGEKTGKMEKSGVGTIFQEEDEGGQLK